MQAQRLAEAVRRLDWRFLLPDPALSSVAFVGPDDDDLLASLRDAAGAAISIHPAGRAVPPTAPGSLVLVSAAGEPQLGDAVGLVAEGGWLYVELPRGSLARGRLQRALHVLERGGFGTPRVHWHWPSLRASKRIVPLDHPAGARATLERQVGRRLRGLEPAIAGLLRMANAIELAGGRVSLLAQRGGDRPSGWLCLEPLAAELRRELGIDEPAWTVLTPRFRASEHVLLLLAVEPGASPRLVAKVARLPDRGDGAVWREVANLRQLESAGVPPDTVPRLLTHGRLGGHAFLVESGLAGRPLDPETVRRDPAGSIALVTDWLGAMPGPVDERAGVEDLVDEPLRRFARDVPGTDAANQRLVDGTLARLEPLRRSILPRVIEHGDLGHPNLLVDRGRLRVLDWESGRPNGLPLHDLALFLGYLAQATARIRDSAEHPAAFRRLLADAATGAADALRREADRLGVERSLIAPLVLACWSRTVVGIAERHPAPPDELDHWIRSSRYYLLWSDALRGLDGLDRTLR